ncbi:hypothetical protein SLE2022_135250 [Rubroshorea leprosula]
MARCTTAVLVAVVVAMLLATPHINATISCEQVVIWLTPCISYGIFGGKVAPECCSGMKALNAAANTTADHRSQCQCVKEGAARIPGLNYTKVNELPDICGTHCPYRLTTDLDCSKVN